jgi:predicted ester cyclase
MHKEDQIKYALDQLIEQCNISVVEEIFTKDYIGHAEDKNYKGREFIKRFTKQVRTAIPDIRVLRVEFLVKASDSISWQRTLQGTHKANMMGIPASDRKIKWNEMVVSRFEGEKITEEWVVSELAGQLLLKQPPKRPDLIKHKQPSFHRSLDGCTKTLNKPV